MIKSNAKKRTSNGVYHSWYYHSSCCRTHILHKFFDSQEFELEIDYKDTASVQFFIDGCLEDTLRDAIFDVAQKGGYYNLPVFSTSDAYVNTAYYLYLGDVYMPTEEIIAESIASYVDDHITDCANFSYFKDLEINASSPSSSVELTENSVAIDLHYPLSIYSRGLVTELSDFSATADSKILTLFNIAQNLTYVQQEYGEMICISCLAALGYEYNLEILAVDGDEGTLFAIFDLDSDIEDFAFRFIHRYYDDTVSLESPCGDISATIEFTRVDNVGAGEAESLIYIGPDAELYLPYEEIPVSQDGSFIYDSGVDIDVGGLALERGDGYLNFILQGGMSGDDLEIMDFVLTLDGATITEVSSNPVYPLENYDDGIYEDDASQDEIIYDGNELEAYMRVSSLNDGFLVYYKCEE